MSIQKTTFFLQDGTPCDWPRIKELADGKPFYFQVKSDTKGLTFWLSQDFFKDSYVLAWMTLDEKSGKTPYLDNRCRSTCLDDFLSRIESLTSVKLTDHLEAVDAEIEDIEAKLKGLKKRKAEILRQSLESAEEDKALTDSHAELFLESIEWDERRPSATHKLEWAVDHISWGKNCAPFKQGWRAEVGAWVAVRPCGEKYEGKTYLGVLLGDVALSVSTRYDPETKALGFEPSFHNPAMYVPDLKEVIYGCGSWWGVIESPEGLKKISDADIDNVWYVRALKELAEKS